MKKFLLMFLVTGIAFGAISTDKKYKLNNFMGAVGRQVALGTLVDEGGTWNLSKDGVSPLKVVQGTYDFSTKGGTSVVDIDLGVSLPDNAVLVRSYIDVITQPVGTSAQVKLTLESSGDVLDATSVASLTGIVEGVSTGSAANMKKMSNNRDLIMNITGNALTAGKFKVYLEYVMSE